MHADMEPFVDAHEVAILLDESRRNVIRMAREGKLTANMSSGTLLTVPDHEDTFIRSLRMNGEWHTLARRIAPDLVATDLLRHQLSPLYICHDFWTTPEAYFRGLHSQAVQNLFLARRQMASACFELGAFSFPALKDSVAPLEPVAAR